MPKPMARREEAIMMSQEHPHISKAILILGVAGLLFVPVFKTITHLPPYMGMMMSLGIIWLVTEILITRYKIDPKLGGRVSQAMRHIDMSSILFFLGILMSVSALQQAGILHNVAGYLNDNIHEPVSIAALIGVLSSIVDNVPLVAACIKMFSGMTGGDPTYLSYFVEDGLFWHLLTFTAGVGGSLLIIGSAAGVVAMGIEKIPFFWYFKRITGIAFLGYLAGILLIWLENFILV
jgi:Na+/H+ antiporter NhaD/arsenite permease-like protein